MRSSFYLNSLIWNFNLWIISCQCTSCYFVFICVRVRGERIFLFSKLPPSHSVIPAPPPFLSPDWSLHELARRLSSVHEARVSAHGGRVWTCTRRGVSSTPTERRGGTTGVGIGWGRRFACPCAKVRRQHPVTSRSSTRASRSLRGRIEPAILRM